MLQRYSRKNIPDGIVQRSNHVIHLSTATGVFSSQK